MSKEKIETLVKIYNAMLSISTKGEDTMLMADCLRALKAFIETEVKEV